MPDVREQLENYIKPGGIASWLLGAGLAVYNAGWGGALPSTYALAGLLLVGPFAYKRNGKEKDDDLGGKSHSDLQIPERPPDPGPHLFEHVRFV